MLNPPSPSSLEAQVLRDHVLQGIARNRVPGLHFPGNFLALERRKFSRDTVALALPAAAHVTDPQGRIGLTALVLQVDVTLATAVRPLLEPGVRTASVSVHLNFTGVAPFGDLLCETHCLGFSRDAVLPQAICRGALSSAQGVVCYCSGTIAQLPTPAGVKLHPMAWEVERGAEVPSLDVAHLTEVERRVLVHAERCIDTLPPDKCFADHFWGARIRAGEAKANGALAIGPHTNNRVGYTQGGLMMAFAMRTAATAVPRHRLIESASAWFISPGVGERLRARSTVLQDGRNLAVVRTEVLAAQGKRVLEVITNHAVARARS